MPTAIFLFYWPNASGVDHHRYEIDCYIGAGRAYVGGAAADAAVGLFAAATVDNAVVTVRPGFATVGTIGGSAAQWTPHSDSMRKHTGALVILMMVLWLPLVRHLFPVSARQERRDALAQTHMRRWQHGVDNDINSMRTINPEWDFMSRTFTVLGLANDVLRMSATDVRRTHTLKVIDRIVDETLAAEQQHGSAHYTLGYIHSGTFYNAQARSLFIDGELLMMMAARNLVQPAPAYAQPMAQRAELIVQHMAHAPMLSGESYPDECWTFCNTTALAALRLYDAAGGGDHAELAAAWVSLAKRLLVEPQTGLLVSSFRYDGSWLDGPEGSSLWMTAHNLLLIDEDFARDQYRRSRQQLGIEVLGFAMAREWPGGLGGQADVDSGPVVPLLGASAGSSGMALLAAASFDDSKYSDALWRSLEFAAFPLRSHGELSYAAAGPMGDAVAFYAAQQGPLWRLANRRNTFAAAAAHAKE